MTDKPYLKYKNKFKLNCVLTAVSCGLAILSAIFLVCVPNFARVNGEGVTVYFSLFDEAIRCFSEVFGGTSKSVWNVYQVVSIIYLAAGIVYAAVIAEKCAVGLFNIDKYCQTQYSKITDGTKKNGGSFKRKFNVPTLFVSGVVLEVFYMIMLGTTGKTNESMSSSLFASSTGVNWTVAFFILSFVAYVAVSVYGWIKNGNLKAEIMREN